MQAQSMIIVWQYCTMETSQTSQTYFKVLAEGELAIVTVHGFSTAFQERANLLHKFTPDLLHRAIRLYSNTRQTVRSCQMEVAKVQHLVDHSWRHCLPLVLGGDGSPHDIHEEVVISLKLWPQ